MGFWVTEIRQNPLNDMPKVIKLSNRSENRPCPFPAADLIFFLWSAWCPSWGNLLFLRGHHGQGEEGGGTPMEGDIGRSTGMGRLHGLMNTHNTNPYLLSLSLTCLVNVWMGPYRAAGANNWLSRKWRGGGRPFIYTSGRLQSFDASRSITRIGRIGHRFWIRK